MGSETSRKVEKAGSVGTRGRLDWWARLVSLGLIGLSLLTLARGLSIPSGLTALRTGIERLGPWGPLAFGCLYAMAVVLMIPGSALTLAAGALFGRVVGTITVSLASNIGAALAFLIARYVARDAVERQIARSPKLKAIDQAIGLEGWKIVALLRLSPAVPFNIQNYFFGVTRIGFWPCVLTSWVAMLPGTVLYVSVGDAGRASLEATVGGERTRSTPEWILFGAGLLATIVLTFFITRLASRAIRRASRFEAERFTTSMPECSKTPGTRKRRFWGTVVLASVAIVLVFLALLASLGLDARMAPANVSTSSRKNHPANDDVSRTPKGTTSRPETRIEN